ncbi:MAG: hypothetical protein A2527_11655 [Candidatus Lambdaproteobacteria bacterium RIFOXYD2_FULL_50_16]|uniref:histidine kinase n=1 Tax=Candidatus Lambdaproteobacteria bacterium RIFOXYD2_FULL_50_16 TaxID=1817772 RepID=A0A1F6G624_9PROT|nr:MAG: hypothetical protein A2527_11655 [Candidatus Lambdaproteobacteria bacterium RIFOXYD2_FULL_50_16]
MPKGIFRYPFYLFLCLMALPLLVTGWVADRQLSSLFNQFAFQLLDQRIDHDLARLKPGPEGLEAWVVYMEPELTALWLDQDGQIRASNLGSKPLDPQLERVRQALVSGASRPLDVGLFSVERPLDRWGMQGHHLLYFQKVSPFEAWLAPLRQLYWLMVGLGGLMAASLALYYFNRVQKPIALILKKNAQLNNGQGVLEGQIDPSLIANTDLGEIMVSRNHVLETIFLECTRNTNILNSIYDGIFVFGPDKRVNRINFAASMMLQYSETELKGMTAEELTRGSEQEWVKYWWNNYQFNSQHPSFEAQLTAKTGAFVPVWCSANLMINPTGQLEGMLLVCRDISIRKALAEKVNKLSLVTEQSPAAVMLLDLMTQVEYVNPSFEKMTGYTSAEVVGRPLAQLKIATITQNKRLALESAISSRATWQGECQTIRKNGQVYWERILMAPILGGNQEVMGFCLIREEITQAKELEVALVEANKGLEQKVERRVAELKAATLELERANEELKGLDRLKDEFIANVSHELRTPLASVMGYAEGMLECQMEREVEERFLKVILSESERLLRLINEVLELSTIELGNQELKVGSVDLDQTVEQCCQILEKLAAENEVTFSKTESAIVFLGDHDRFQQLLINLMANALKFAPANSVVEIKVGPDNPGYFRLEVRDYGEGIPMDQLESIFNRFQQAKNQKTGKKGTGLGLTLARKIVEAHQGRIWAENALPGARFVCVLPVNFVEKADV